MRNLAFILLSLAASLPGLAQAQEPPGRVGRLAYTQGTVSVYQDPELGWDKAYVNTPITSENSVWTDRGARAELRVSGIAIRLDETTQLDVSRLDEDQIDAGLERGSANIRVRYKQPNERITLDTPQARFTIEADGRYRIDVDPERDESRLTVFAGDARMQSQGGSIRVNAGSTVRVFGGASSSYVTERASSDAFDSWADARDKEWTDSKSRQYVSTEMTGYEDLDRYGQWAQEPDYGAVWFPTRVASDWAPYRTGHWSYLRPWGWTWVDDAPWGYAPFHYGRWVYVRNRWAWSPGQRVSRPAWAPALVGWVGGSNWSVSISGGSAPVVGWYPLAPWERYEPPYRSNRTYTDRLNIAVRDRTPREYQGRGDDWRRLNRDRGATVVQRDALIDRRPVQGARVQVGADTLRQQQTVAPAQVQQLLPQGNELIRRRVDRNQAPAAAPPVQQAQPARPVQQGQRGQPQQQGRPQPAQGNDQGARPNFARRGAPAPAPAPAPANTPPVRQAAPAPVNPFNPVTPSAANPAARGPAAQQQPQQQPQQQQQAREAQQQQERARAEALQQQQLQQQRQAREAQQQQERTQRDAQQLREAERARAEAAQQQQAQQQRQVRDAQQQQERAAREGQQQREAQQRQQQEAAQREAQQQQQAQQQRQAREAQQQHELAQVYEIQEQIRSALQLQQQQERAAREAQQQAQQAAQQAQQATQRAAQQAQEAQQQQNRAARGGQPPQPPAQPQPAPQPQAQPQPAPQPQANPAARGSREQQQRDKDEKDKKDKKDKEDK